ncbi:MAG: sensor histidine kinase [Azoarcus sp.]|jgi:two-component system sensor histidine kinase TctE|nr:sensor histidine kinase [Azoarcus sp.]MDX9837168.1 sensor histidine kinase [Azoarcus sp.]
MQISLYRRLLQNFAGPTFLLLITAGGISYGIAKSVVGTAYDQNLINLAHGVANHVLVQDGKMMLDLTGGAEQVLRTDTIDDIYFRVRAGNGTILGGDADLPSLASERARNGTAAVDVQPNVESLPAHHLSAPQFFDSLYRGAPIRAVRLQQTRDQRTVYVTVGETLNKRQQAMERLLLGFGSAAVMLLAAATLAVRLGIPSGLAPLKRLEDELRGRTGTDFSPLSPRTVPLEIREVVRALNAIFDRLRAANTGQRQFLQDAAHQLRTPLAGLQMQIELLESHPADPAALTRLKRSVQRVTRLANQLLALARAEAGAQLMVNASTVDFAHLIDDMVEEWLEKADARSIDLGIVREPVSIVGDPTLLRELIANLMDNALRYTPNGGEVSLRCEARNGMLELDVGDTGPGIPEDRREAVFERFYRLPETSLSGSGLGLPIAREIARCHHGSIEICATPRGKGTLVQVRLPLTQ